MQTISLKSGVKQNVDIGAIKQYSLVESFTLNPMTKSVLYTEPVSTLLLYLKVELGQPEFLLLGRLFVLLTLVSHILLTVYVWSVAVDLLVIRLKKENSKNYQIFE
jgi:hypothetical protein